MGGRRVANGFDRGDGLRLGFEERPAVAHPAFVAT